MLIGMTGLIIATLPQPGFAQSDPLTGLWQINLAKTKFSPGPGPKSQTLNIQGEGQNRKATVVGITAQGNPQAVVFTEVVEDGKPHAVTGLAGTDAQSYTRVDARTLNVSRMKGRESGPGRDLGRITGWQDADGYLHRQQSERTADQQHFRLRQAIGVARLIR
jgi:hypothetical protein